MLDLALSKIVFGVDTSALDTAIQRVGQVEQSVVRLGDAQARTAERTAKAEALLAKARAADAKARESDAKAAAIAAKVELDRLTAIANQANAASKAQAEADRVAAQAAEARARSAATAANALTRQEEARARTALAAVVAENNHQVAVTRLAQAETARQAAAARAATAAVAGSTAAANATSRELALIERIEQRRNLISEGWTRGEASILRTATSLGIVGDDLVRLQGLLRDTSGLLSNPFDNAIGSIRSVNAEFNGLTVRAQLAQQGIELSAKQLREYSRIAAEVTVAVKRMGLDPTQGQGLIEYNRLLTEGQTEYLRVAQAARGLRTAETDLARTHRDTAAAQRFLIAEDQRMIDVTAQLSGGTNRQVTIAQRAAEATAAYAAALRTAGVAGTEAASRLAAYAAQQQRFSQQEEARAGRHLARGLQPQITDVAVSLYSGQNPLTVLFQQGGQALDMFVQSGVPAVALAATLKASFKDMIPNILALGVAVRTLAIEGFQALGATLIGLPARMLGITSWLQSLRIEFGLAAGAGSRSAGIMSNALEAVANVIPKVTGVVGASAVVIGGAFVAAITSTTKELNELIRTVETSGAKLGLSAKGIQQFALGLKDLNTGDAIEFLTGLAKASVTGTDNLEGLTKAALDLEKYGGVALEDTAKAYKELSDKPYEGLLKLAEGTGRVTKETLDNATALLRQKDMIGLTKLAQEEFARVNQETANSIRSQLDPVTSTWISIKAGISDAWETFKNFARSDTIASPLADVGRRIATVFGFVGLAIKNAADAVASLISVATTGQAAMIPFSGVSIGDAIANRDLQFQTLKDSMALNREELDKYLASLDKVPSSAANATKGNAEYAAGVNKTKEITDAAAKVISESNRKMLSRVEVAAKAEADLLNITKEASAEQITLVRQAAEIKYDQENKAKKTRTEQLKVATTNEISTLKEQYASELGLAKALGQDKQEILRNQFEAGVISREAYNATVMALVQSSEQAQLDVINKNRQLYNETTEKDRKRIIDTFNALPAAAREAGTNIAKYHKQLDDLQRSNVSFNKVLDDTTEKIKSDAFARASKAVYDHIKAIKELNSIYKEYADKERDLIAQKERDAALTFALANATPRQAAAIKAVSDEVKRQEEAQAKLRNAVLSTKKAYDDLLALTATGAGSGSIALDISPEEEQARVKAFESYEVARKNLTKAITDNSVKQEKAAIDAVNAYDLAERKKLAEDITGVITTSLFEGGKAGSKAFRNLIINELKKPVTFVVNAVVNTLLGAIFGGLTGGASGVAGAANAGGSLLGTVGNVIGLGKGAGAAYTGLTSGGGFWGGLGSSLGIHGSSTAASTFTVGGVATAPAAPTGFMANLGSAMPWIAGGIAALAALGAFRKTKTVGAGISGELGGGALREYELTRKSGYLFGGPTYKYKDLGESKQSEAIQDAYKAMRTSTVEMAKSLGLDYKKIENYKTGLGTQIHPDTGKQTGINLMGLSEAEAQNKVAEALATANNEMAQQVLGTWEETTEKVTRTIKERRWDNVEGEYVDFIETVTDTTTRSTYKASEYAKKNETAIETLTRLATSLGTVNAYFDTLGNTLYQSSLAGADMASKLIDAFGGLEKFTSSIEAYYNSYYSEEEKKANLTRQVTNELAKHNIALPKSKEEYRKLVEAQDLSTEEGRKMYAFLVQLAPLFAQIGDAVDRVSETIREAIGRAIDDARRADDERRRAAEEAQRGRDTAMLNQAEYEAQRIEAERQARSTAYDALVTAVNAEKALLQKQISDRKSSIDQLQAIFDLLKTNVKELYQQVTSTSIMLADQGRAVINQALSSGVLPDGAVLGEAIGAVRRQIESTNYSTKFESDRARLLLAADLLTLQGTAEVQLSTEELMLKALEDQVKALDDILANAKKQLDAFLGVETAVLSVADALDRFTDLINKPIDLGTFNTRPVQVASPGFEVGGGNVRDPQPVGNQQGLNLAYLSSYVKDLAWGSAEADKASSAALAEYAKQYGLSQADIAKVTGFSINDVNKHFDAQGISRFATGGDHVGGLRIVGENGPELEATGAARIFNANDTKRILSDEPKDNGALIAQIEMLRAETRSTAISTSKLLKIFERITVPTADGEALQTTAV